MGCDVHGYVEYREPGSDFVYEFGGRINPGRDYALFAAMAGVRGPQPAGLVPPRGLPAECGFHARADWALAVNDNDRDVRTCTRQQAERWVKSGSSVWIEEGKRVSHPDWHTPSWLTTAELGAAMRAACSIHGEPYPDAIGVAWRALLAAMQVLPNARLVFWFDN